MTLTECFNNLCKKLKSLVTRVEGLEARSVYKSSVVNNGDGTYTHSDGDAGSTLIDYRPSDVACNGLRVDTVGKLYVEGLGYRRAKDWTELKSLLDAGTPAFVCDEIVATDAHVFDSGAIWFAPGGSIDTAGFAITLNIPLENPDNHQVFTNFVLDETYPARGTGGGSNLRGTFGGAPSRDPRWFGLTTSENGNTATLAEATANNNAIAAAALTAPIVNGKWLPTRVELPQGIIPIHRTIRLDGLRCSLVGSGGEPSSHGGTRLWCESSGFEFDTTHYIETELFPSGATPVIEVGYERDSTAVTQDEGFQCGVQGLAIVCPVNNIQGAGRVSGIMWESGLQENSKFSQLSISNYSAYGIGGPNYQTQDHNVPNPGDTGFPQVNSVVFEEFWIFDVHASFNDTNPFAIFGLNWEVRNASIIQVTGGPTYNTHTNSAMRCGSRTAGRVANIHFETSPAVGAPRAAIEVVESASGQNQGLHFDSITNDYKGNVPGGLDSSTILIDDDRASVTCTNIFHDGSENPAFTCIKDIQTGRIAAGGKTHAGASMYVPFYSRCYSYVSGGYHVDTTDPGLDLSGSAIYDPANLADGAGVTTTLAVVGARPGNYAEASFSNDLQGILLTAWVSANDTVSVRFQNETGAPLDLASGDLRARVRTH
jgi:hypothetical protein